MSAVLERLSLEGSAENDQRGISAQLKAAHLLVSAMDGERKIISAENRKQFFSMASSCSVFSFVLELSDEVLSLLTESSPDFLEAFDTLVCFIFCFYTTDCYARVKNRNIIYLFTCLFYTDSAKNIYNKKMKCQIAKKIVTSS